MTLPVIVLSGLENVAVSVGVTELTLTPSAGAPRTGMVGAEVTVTDGLVFGLLAPLVESEAVTVRRRSSGA